MSRQNIKVLQHKVPLSGRWKGMHYVKIRWYGHEAGSWGFDYQNALQYAIARIQDMRCDYAIN